MKLLIIILSVSLGLFPEPSFVRIASALTVSNYPANTAAGGIASSRHNLGATGQFIASDTSGTSEICVFCHTPHHVNNFAPLWNRTNSSPSYSAYGTTAAGTAVSSVGPMSLACLSCHDGVTTFDNIVNSPSPGGINTAGSQQGWSFINKETGAVLGVSPLMPSAGDLGRLDIGISLSNDHPVSVTYNPLVASLRPTDTVIAAIDLSTGFQSNAATAYDNNISQNRWAVKGVISNTATIGDLLRDGKVECSSCHDPHFSNKSWDEIEKRGSYAGYADDSKVDGLFLRRVGGNTGSGVCRTCHKK